MQRKFVSPDRPIEVGGAYFEFRADEGEQLVSTDGTDKTGQVVFVDVGQADELDIEFKRGVDVEREYVSGSEQTGFSLPKGGVLMNEGVSYQIQSFKPVAVN